MILALATTKISDRIISAFQIARVDLPQFETCEEKAVDIGKYIESANSLKAQMLIVDENAIIDSDMIADALNKYRLLSPDTKVIFITAPGESERNPLYGQLVQQGIYNILLFSEIEEYFENELADVLTNPDRNNYASCARFLKSDSPVSQKKAKTGLFKNPPKPAAIVETKVRDRILGQVTVAVAGTQHRTGTTHLAIQLAKTVQEANQKVAVILEERVFQDLLDTIEDAKPVNTNKSIFDLVGIHFYKSTNISSLTGTEYKYIICDCGVFEGEMEEYKKSTIKILTGSGKEWELPYLEAILESEDEIFLKSIAYVLNYCDDENYQFIRSNMPGFNVFQADYEPMLFKTSNTSRQLLSSVLPQNHREEPQTKKKKGFWGK